MTTPPRAMTIGGSDSGAAAGIQADLKTFAAFGVYGTSVLTAVTAQNTREVAAIAEVPEEIVIAQIDTIMEDIGADAMKTGMLLDGSIIECVVDRLEAWGAPNLVVDPVLVSPSGVPLLKLDAVGQLKRELLPLALIATPTLQQAEVLSGRSITSPAEAREAARAIHALGPQTVIIKGHQEDVLPSDLVFDGDAFTELGGEPIGMTRFLGTGTAFSAAITALLARRVALLPAIEGAKRYVERAQRTACAVGDGRIPLNHLHAAEPVALGGTAAT